MVLLLRECVGERSGQQLWKSLPCPKHLETILLFSLGLLFLSKASVVGTWVRKHQKPGVVAMKQSSEVEPGGSECQGHSWLRSEF